MKFLVTCCLILTLASVALASSSSWGKRNSSDYLLLRENVIRYPVKNNFWNAQVDFPKSGQINSRRITAIYVYDRFPNSTGALPAMKSGGPNYTYTLINLQSQVNRGINSTVEIYGK